MLDQLSVDSKKYIILPHFSFKGDDIIFLDKYKYFVAGDNFKLSNTEKINFLLNEGVIIRKRIKQVANKKCKDKILIIEPHPDDFVLSASGFVLDKEWRDVKVMNIFSKTLVANFPWSDKFFINESEFEKIRMKESSFAIEQYFEFKFESLRLPLAQKRGYENNFHARKTKSEPCLVEMLSKKIVNEMEKNNYDVLLCPLGVKKHVDHIVAFEACTLAYEKIKKQKNNFQVVFYEEYPYARNKRLLLERLEYVRSFFKLKKIIVKVNDYLQLINDSIMIYRSQFDNINSKQMLEVIKRDFEIVAIEEGNSENDKGNLFQRYYEIEKIL